MPNAIFWDDWTLYGVKSADILDTFHQAGSMFNLAAYTHISMIYLGVWSYKFFTFFLMFGAAILLDTILKNLKFLSVDGRICIVLMFMVLPLNWARVAMIDFIYTLCYFLFFLAWALMSKKRILALFFFFLSFNTNSTLVFYILPMLFHYFTNYSGGNLFFYTNRFFLKNLEFIFLPFVYFFIKTTFYSPHGLFANYNNVFNFDLARLHSFAVYQIAEFMRYFQTHFVGTVVLLFILVGSLFLTFAILKFRFFNKPANYKLSFVAILLGTFASLCAVIPYWVVGHIPTFGEWTSRHQLLMPLGASVLFFSVFLLLHHKVRVIALSLILSISIVTNIKTYKDFYFDWQKQVSLIMLFSNSEEIRNSQIIVFKDHTLSDNAIERTFRSYEWNGILATSFGDEKRLGLSVGDYNQLVSNKFFRGYFTDKAVYRISEFDIAAQNKVVNVEVFDVPVRTKKEKILSLIGFKRYRIVSASKGTISLDMYN